MDLTSFLMGRITGGGDAPSSTRDKPVKFIDYDGTIVYSYTPEEFLALDCSDKLVYICRQNSKGK